MSHQGESDERTCCCRIVSQVSVACARGEEDRRCLPLGIDRISIAKNPFVCIAARVCRHSSNRKHQPQRRKIGQVKHPLIALIQTRCDEFCISSIGIKVFTSLIKDQENNLIKLKILLMEILVAVYMSLLIYALSTDDCNTLYRLVTRKWSTPESAVKLWYGVFGGGAKKPLPVQPNPSSSNLSSSGK